MLVVLVSWVFPRHPIPDACGIADCLDYPAGDTTGRLECNCPRIGLESEYSVEFMRKKYG